MKIYVNVNNVIFAFAIPGAAKSIFDCVGIQVIYQKSEK